MKRISKNAGFSLVELMVVVAIIGILAAVAIPNFTKFQRRARAAEGRALISAIYDGEKASFASYEGYADNFGLIGFRPEGNQLRTDAGFATDSATLPVSCTGTGINVLAATSIPAAQAVGSIKKYCAGGSCAMAAGAAPTAASGTLSNAAGAEVFKASSSTDCGGGAAAPDAWTIDNNKAIVQTADCTNT